MRTRPATLPDGVRIYAVGDIHGRFDLLQTLAAKIAHDLKTARPAQTIEVYLGDYIDRGPSSREVIDWMMETPPLADRRICLMGNHEDLLLRAIEDSDALSNWLFNGGDATITSYLAGGKPRRDFATLAEVRTAFFEAFPERHRAFLASLPRMVEIGGYVFVHAGIRPGRPLADQDPEDLIWIREPFLRSSADFGKIVVHGHTPSSRPETRKNRINIDTGAVFGGALTCLVLEGATRRFMQAPAA